MKITSRDAQPTVSGSPVGFTGQVFFDVIATAEPPNRTSGSLTRFMPGARTAWHTHPCGQTIYITEGVGRCQSEGGPVVELRAGDRVYFEPGENHWHGASPDQLMTHIAIQETDGDGTVVWGRHVTKVEYLGICD